MEAEILRTCRALFAPAQVAELRVLEIKGSANYKFNASGWFNDFEKLAAAAVKYSERHPSGIYVTINPLHEACIARTDNHIIERAKDATSDRDVVRRHWLPIDIDPIRPSGVSSSIEELNGAKNIMLELVAFLKDKFQFPDPLTAHSGNGIHVLYRIDLPNNEASRELIRGALLGLAEKFDNNVAKVDCSLFNAARILKLWGTITRKGQHTDDRPHRQSKLWTKAEFASFRIVDEDQLSRVRALGRKSSATPSTAKSRVSASSGKSDKKEKPLFDLDGWIAENKVKVSRSEPFDGEGVRHILEHCLFDTTHVRTSAVIGRAPNGAIFYKCQHDSCKDKDWKAAKALFGKKKSSREQEEKEVAASPWRMASMFIDEEYCNDDLGRVTLRRHRGTFYVYSSDEHVYRSISDDKIKMQITRWLGEAGDDNTSRAINDIYTSTCSMVTVPEEIEMPFRTTVSPDSKCATANPAPHNWITLRNGILDVRAVMDGKPISDCLYNHTAEWFSTTSLRFDFPTTDRAAECPKWLDFLDEVLQEDETRIAVIQEMFGYCFFRDTSLEKFFILHGRGNNGKSTILEMLVSLLDERNVTSLALDQIADPVMCGELYQKVANICGDLPELEQTDESMIKRITSGEMIMARRLYKGPMRFRPTAKLIFSTNPLPKFSDVSLGIWRRMILIPFEYVVLPDNVNPNLRTELMHELPGIFVWALKGTARLASTGRFTKSPACEQSLRGHRMTCFPVLTFLQECTIPEGSVKTRTLWQTYKLWCSSHGLTKVKPLHSFVKDVINFYPNIEYPRVPNGQAGDIELKGIDLVPNLLFGSTTA